MVLRIRQLTREEAISHDGDNCLLSQDANTLFKAICVEDGGLNLWLSFCCGVELLAWVGRGDTAAT